MTLNTLSTEFTLTAVPQGTFKARCIKMNCSPASMTKKSGKANNTCFYPFFFFLVSLQAEYLIRRQHEVVRVKTEALTTTATSEMKLCLQFFPVSLHFPACCRRRWTKRLSEGWLLNKENKLALHCCSSEVQTTSYLDKHIRHEASPMPRENKLRAPINTFSDYILHLPRRLL